MDEKEIREKYFGYATKVLNGEIAACQYIKDACKRNLDRFNREDMYFDPEAVDKVVNFLYHLKHFTGEFAGKPFILEEWQLNIVSNVFGWKWKKNGLRVCRALYFEIARKCGKTSLCAGLLLYLMIADGEANASVVLSANSAKQAGLCFNICSNFLKSIDPNDKYFKRYRDTIKFPKTLSQIKVVAADASKLDGENCHAFLCDELHEAPDGSVYNVLETSMGSRRQPLAMVATTAGFNLTSFCYDQRTYNLKVLKSVVQDDTLQAFIYCLDEGDDWKDEAVWEKACPNIDVSVSRDYIKSQIAKAIENPALEISIRTKLTNEWCSTASSSFIPMNYIMDSSKTINLDDWKDKDITCFMGLDLSSVCDISAIALMWEYDGKYYFKNWYFLPESALKDSVNKEMYRKWATTNDIIITPGNSIDYDYIKGKIMELCNEFIIHTIHYDPWQSTYLVQKLVEEGIPVQPYSQSIGSMSKPSKELLRLTLNGNVVLDNNAATLYMFKCAIPFYDVNENLKIKKVSAEKDKIDGVIADVMALAGSLSLQQWDNEIGTTNI